jgi:hypothetical protein
VTESRKQAVSIRMSGADVRRVKYLAERFGVRDSDVIRFAVKTLLSRLAPLCDADVKGRALVPVFVEAGPDLLRGFELDVARLDAIINEGVEPDRRVDRDDIALLAMHAQQTRYALLRLSSIGNGARHASPNGAGEADSGEGATGMALRQYLYGKYVYRTPADEPGEPAVVGAA